MLLLKRQCCYCTQELPAVVMQALCLQLWLPCSLFSSPALCWHSCLQDSAVNGISQRRKRGWGKNHSGAVFSLCPRNNLQTGCGEECWRSMWEGPVGVGVTEILQWEGRGLPVPSDKTQGRAGCHGCNHSLIQCHRNPVFALSLALWTSQLLQS